MRYSFDELVLYQKGSFVDGEPVHIYLDGDGVPATRYGRPTRDPTTRKYLILKLMAADPNPSILIGRPCYYGTSDACDARLWTSARYSNAVITRLSDAITTITARYGSSAVTLIGYSGGGTLAMLIAGATHGVQTVVTIAANLDTERWVAQHGYGALSESENPATRPPLAADIRQVHFFGAEDDNVPVDIARHVIARQPNARTVLIPNFNHDCCWAQRWGELLAEISAPSAR